MKIDNSHVAMTISPPPPHGFTWENLMDIALEEARKACLNEEVPVGALIVTHEGKILAQAHNRTRTDNDPTAHAEIVAIRAAAKVLNNFRLTNAYLVVTLEPCLMCLGAIREARLDGIVFGAYDKEVGAVCSLIDGTELSLKSPKPWFMGGVRKDNCQNLLLNFFQNKR